MFIATAKTLGIEVETVEAGDTSQASSLSGACWFQFSEGGFRIAFKIKW